MSERQAVKRPLDITEGDFSRRGAFGLNLKRYQHDGYSSSVSASRSSSRGSYGRASTPGTVIRGAEKRSMESEERVVAAPQMDCLLPRLSGVQNSSVAQYLNLPSSNLNVSSRPTKEHIRNEEICFGMLKEVEIRIIAIHNKNFRNLKGSEKEPDLFAPLDLLFEQDRCDIKFCGITIANMQTKTYYALQQVLKCSNEAVRYHPLIPQAELVEKLNAALQPLGVEKSKLILSIDLQIFGVRSIADTVAKGLSKYRLFLQHPYPMPVNAAYENPQYFSLSGSSFTNGALLPAISVESTRDKIESTNINDEVDCVLDEVQAIINNLPSHYYLGEAIIDERINKDLLPHQKIAVDFVRKREAIEQPSPSPLWHAEDSSLSGLMFRHKITGAKSKMPDDVLGGILADDMGLGKTLIMIAAIVTNLSEAISFAGQKSFQNRGFTGNKTPTMATLIIVPCEALLWGWIQEIEKHVIPGVLKTHIYHGPGRNLAFTSPSSLPSHVVLSTYSTVAADFGAGGGVLDSFDWYRLILDEAHTIRNPATKSFKAVHSLSANIRWCMTGTPVQNSLDDLRSLIQFLRVPQLENRTVFQRFIAQKGRMVKGSLSQKPDYGNLKLLLASVCLRRRISSLSLGVTFTSKSLDLSKVERQTYRILEIACKRAYDTAISGRKTKKRNRVILTTLLRMRIFCNTGFAHSEETIKETIEQFNEDEMKSLLQQGSTTPVCVACGCDILSFDSTDNVGQPFPDSSYHLKCEECRQLVVSISERGVAETLCADIPMPDLDSQAAPQPTQDVVPAGAFKMGISGSDISKYPSKMLAVLSDIKEHYSEDKSIVFSFWKKSLDLLAQILHENDVVFGQVDGTLSPDQRQKVLKQFHSDPTVRVLLITLGTGAQGINNISVANRIHILEPQWNPSVEDQAIGRALRLGQEKQVCVVRYIMRKTIEECVKDRQTVKVQLASAGGLHSPDTKDSAENQNTIGLQELSKIIKSTVSSNLYTAASQEQDAASFV